MILFLIVATALNFMILKFVFKPSTVIGYVISALASLALAALVLYVFVSVGLMTHV